MLCHIDLVCSVHLLFQTIQLQVENTDFGLEKAIKLSSFSSVVFNLPVGHAQAGHSYQFS